MPPPPQLAPRKNALLAGNMGNDHLTITTSNGKRSASSFGRFSKAGRMFTIESYLDSDVICWYII